MPLGIVSFSYSDWALRYPELALYVIQAQAQLYFNEASLYCDNTPRSPVQCVTTRELLLNMLTAHIAQLNAYINGQAPSNIVGRVNDATEGSVTIRTQNEYPPGTAQWYQQTRYGASYWAATPQYRRFKYFPGGPQHPFGLPNGIV